MYLVVLFRGGYYAEYLIQKSCSYKNNMCTSTVSAYGEDKACVYLNPKLVFLTSWGLHSINLEYISVSYCLNNQNKMMAVFFLYIKLGCISQNWCQCAAVCGVSIAYLLSLLPSGISPVMCACQIMCVLWACANPCVPTPDVPNTTGLNNYLTTTVTKYVTPVTNL